MYVGLKQPRGDGERYVTPARAAAKETRCQHTRSLFDFHAFLILLVTDRCVRFGNSWT